MKTAITLFFVTPFPGGCASTDYATTMAERHQAARTKSCEDLNQRQLVGRVTRNEEQTEHQPEARVTDPGPNQRASPEGHCSFMVHLLEPTTCHNCDRLMAFNHCAAE